MQFIYRFVIGGVVVSLFAILSDTLKPRSFAGLFGAAPSVALATLGLTVLINGKAYAALEARSMIAGAVALCVYVLVCMYLMARYHFHAAPTTIWSLSVWAISAFLAWLSVLR